MDINFGFLLISIVKIVARPGLGLRPPVGAGTQAALGEDAWASWPPSAIIQLGHDVEFGGFQVLNDFDSGLLFQACTMTMVALGLNLIYGFNGQFSLGQWGFYGIGRLRRGGYHLSLDQSGMPRPARGGDRRDPRRVGDPGRAASWCSGTRACRCCPQFTLYLIGAVAGRRRRRRDRATLGHTVRGAAVRHARCARASLHSPLVLQVVFCLAVLIGGVVRGRSQLPVRPAGPDAGQRLLRHRDPGLHHRRQHPDGQLRHHPALPGDEGRPRHDRHPQADDLVLGLRLPARA